MNRTSASALLLALLSCCTFLIQPAGAAANQPAAGAQLFRDKGCAYCHGDHAQGTPKGPSLADIRKRMKDEQVANQIENGGQKMPSFGDTLSKDEVAQLVAFLRARHRPAIPPASVSNPAQ